ncbi:hypothetical protein KC19_1G000500 [Ceratodon purpureus]|uniref:Uncharacterized protein n=1 Tax=Ceratodon purpureus TaxID=3225 RepID=A0A8T0J2I8_CERPU|nr:hypothetical protein KC19_1G000500 [Ceratodon purpureus]
MRSDHYPKSPQPHSLQHKNSKPSVAPHSYFTHNSNLVPSIPSPNRPSYPKSPIPVFNPPNTGSSIKLHCTDCFNLPTTSGDSFELLKKGRTGHVHLHNDTQKIKADTYNMHKTQSS